VIQHLLGPLTDGKSKYRFKITYHTHTYTHIKSKKGKGRVLAIVLLTRELVTKSALQSRKWQLIGMS